jgi:hypothetical protein
MNTRKFRDTATAMLFAASLGDKVHISSHTNDDNTITLHWVEKTSYKDKNGKTIAEEVWMEEDGRMTEVKDLELERLHTIVRRLLSRNRENTERQHVITEMLNKLFGDENDLLDNKPSIH